MTTTLELFSEPTTEDRIEPETDGPPTGPLTAAELLEVEARRYDGWGNGLGLLAAAAMRSLAKDVTATGTSIYHVHLDRLWALELERQAAYEREADRRHYIVESGR